jgi:hypothetical protein
LVWKSPQKLWDASFGVTKKFPFARFMNHEITRLRGSGMLDAILEKHGMKKPICEETNDEVKSISIQKVILPFVIVSLGMTLALLILAAEKLRRMLGT